MHRHCSAFTTTTTTTIAAAAASAIVMMIIQMNLRTLLTRYSKGELSIEELQRQISIDSIEQVANKASQLDVHREIRKEIPEVIFAKGKEFADLLEIATVAANRNDKVIVSKIQPEHLLRLCRALKKRGFQIEVGNKSTTILVSSRSHHRSTAISEGKVGILAAGTSDIGIAEEARLMAEAMGCKTLGSYDIGIAGIHRLFPSLREMISENVGAIVVVAGMEGALASVVTSMVNIPVIGVPTSVGYGFGSDGLAALASMLQSCALGLSVVNIDNGIGAGAFAALISNKLARNTASGTTATMRPTTTRRPKRNNNKPSIKINES